jgi:hypothetical protein
VRDKFRLGRVCLHVIITHVQKKGEDTCYSRQPKGIATVLPAEGFVSYLEDKLVNAHRNRTHHDGFKDLVVCIAVRGANIDDLPFEI